ncbi:hypothetical protein ACUN24_19955 [Pedobacter sp. WC2501]|uniref:hypothetical protein n=1 Tax=Pedobacter sp. WC2501 TaxID=3461400 RepID=UPI00404669EC
MTSAKWFSKPGKTAISLTHSTTNTMENYQISISWDKKTHHFEVGEYLHQNGESCKVRYFNRVNWSLALSLIHTITCPSAMDD